MKLSKAQYQIILNKIIFCYGDIENYIVEYKCFPRKTQQFRQAKYEFNKKKYVFRKDEAIAINCFYFIKKQKDFNNISLKEIFEYL